MGIVLELLLIFVVVRVVYGRLARRLDALERGTGEATPPADDRRVWHLERRLATLERRVADMWREGLTATAVAADDESEGPAAPAVDEDPAEPPVILPSLQTIAGHPLLRDALQGRPTPPPAAQPPEPVMAAPSPGAERWRQLERRLAENWTGILGTAVLVAGITFIGAYAGLQLSPFFRSVLVVGAAGVLAGAAQVLGRNARWVPLARWLRSGGAAVFLFAMFASSAVPGLRWITALAPALAALVLGVAVNLVVAWAAHAQVFASLHVVLSLVPLLLVPQSVTSLALATLVTVAGLGLALRPQWHRHALVTLAAYVVYHVAWRARVPAGPAALPVELVATASALLVAAAGVFAHYRRAYATAALETAPFLVHLVSWALLGVAVGTYVEDPRWRSAALLAAALGLFVLARHGRAAGVRWVHLTDTLVAQAFAMAAIVSVRPLVFHWLVVPIALFVEAAIYLRVVIDEEEPLLVRSGVVLLHLGALATFVPGLFAAAGATRTLQDQHALLLLAAAVLGTGVHAYLVRRRGETFDSWMSYNEAAAGPSDRVSLLGVGVGLITLAALVNLSGGRWMATAGSAATVGFVLLAGRTRSQALGIAAWLALAAGFVLAWSRLLAEHPVPPTSQLLFQLGPLGIGAAVAIGRAPVGPIGSVVRRSAVYLLGIHAAVAAYTLLQPLSPLVPGIVWLTLSLVALEMADRLRGDALAPTLHLGYAYLAAFAGAYVLVVLQTQAYLGPIPVRVLVEAFALAVAAYWWRFRPRGPLAEHTSWTAVHPLWLELLVLFVATVTIVEVAVPWRPLAWSAMAVACIAPRLGGRLEDRLRFYSLILFWASAIDLAAVTSLFAVPSPAWHEHPGVTGALAIAVQIGYLILGPRHLALTAIAFPAPLDAVARWARTVAARQAAWVYYPFFLAGAVFLYWRFAAAVLTLLWAGEAFIVFVLSLLLRENHFRYMALAALAACLVRLLVFDMAQANLALRGVVFLGVGVLMLAMNALYNRYKDRFA